MPKYYDAWEPGTFPAQRPLCLVLQDTEYALEEQDINPLTIRLATAYQSANSLDQLIRDAGRGLPRLWQEAVALWGQEAPQEEITFTEVMLPTPAGEAQTVAAVALVGREGVLKTHVAADHQAFAFPMVEAQQLLLQFFSSYSAALDRVAWEMDRLLTLESKQSGWRALTAWKHGQNRALRRLREKEPALSAWVTGFHAEHLEEAYRYLDSLGGIGYIPARAAVDAPSRRWRLWVGPAVGTQPVELATDAVQLCRVLMRDGLTVINTIYHILYRRSQDHGLPPW